jgi:hypothetical protein
MSFWGTAQLPAAFLVICLPSVPKLINYIRTKPWCVRLETSLRSKFKVPVKKVPTSRKITTIGGGPKGNHKGTVVSDVEFRDLMATGGTTQSKHSQVVSAMRISPGDEA